MLIFDLLARSVLTYHRQIRVQGLRKAVRWVIMGCPDLNAASLRLKSNSSVNHQSLCSTNAKVRMEEDHPHHPAHKNESVLILTESRSFCG